MAAINRVRPDSGFWPWSMGCSGSWPRFSSRFCRRFYFRFAFIFCLVFFIAWHVDDTAARAEGKAANSHAADLTPQYFDLSYHDYGRELSKYVQGESGLVHYRQWQRDEAGLTAFVGSVAKLDPGIYEKFDRNQRLAFWLNVYNALAIKSVLDHYPIKATVDYFPASSIRQFNDGWEVLKFEVMGAAITLYDIEHDRLRLGFRDPRVHFAVASASMDSARISKKPFVAAGLDQRLDDLARRFFAQPDTFIFDPEKGKVCVSKIFSWFTLDFAAKSGNGKMVFPPPKDEDIILDYISLYLPDDRRAALVKARHEGRLKFDYLPYDWTLNDADADADRPDVHKHKDVSKTTKRSN